MKKVDANIELVGVGSYIDQQNTQLEWNVDMVKTAGKYLDYLSVHTYVSGKLPYTELLSTPIQIERNLKTTYELVRSVSMKHLGGRNIRLAFDEWNVWYPEAKAPLHDQVTSVKDGLFTALVLNALLRLPNQVPVACFAQTVNVLPLILARDDGAMYVNPQYLAFKMFANNTGRYSLNASVQSPCYHSAELNEDLPVLDVSATLGEDRKTLNICTVSKDAERSVECSLIIRGLSPRIIEHQYMSRENMDGKNTFEKPNDVTIVSKRPSRVDPSSLTVTLPAHSVNLITLNA